MSKIFPNNQSFLCKKMTVPFINITKFFLINFFLHSSMHAKFLNLLYQTNNL